MSTTARSSGSSSVGPDRLTSPARVFLDANALFLPFVGHTDLPREIGRHVDHPKIWVPHSVLTELQGLAMRGEPHAAEALALAARFPVAPNRGTGDAAILGLVAPGDAVVTADRELQRRLVALGVDVLVPRDRTRLERWRGDPPRPARDGRTRGNG